MRIDWLWTEKAEVSPAIDAEKAGVLRRVHVQTKASHDLAVWLIHRSRGSEAERNVAECGALCNAKKLFHFWNGLVRRTQVRAER